MKLHFHQSISIQTPQLFSFLSLDIIGTIMFTMHGEAIAASVDSDHVLTANLPFPGHLFWSTPETVAVKTYAEPTLTMEGN